MRRYFGPCFLTILLMSSIVGCASEPEQAPDSKASKSTSKRPTAKRLYDAILKETQARKWGVDTASEEHLLVGTMYEFLNPQFRKRRVMRVLVLPKGGALQVKVDYERNTGTKDAPQWIPVEDALTKQRARKEEMLLGRAIEKRFQSSTR